MLFVAIQKLLFTYSYQHYTKLVSTSRQSYIAIYLLQCSLAKHSFARCQLQHKPSNSEISHEIKKSEALSFLSHALVLGYHELVHLKHTRYVHKALVDYYVLHKIRLDVCCDRKLLLQELAEQSSTDRCT